MPVRPRSAHVLGPATVAIGLVFALSSCGGTTSTRAAADSVVAKDPVLRSRLATIDADVVDGRYTDAVSDLRSLVADTKTALRSGRIDQAQSDAVLQAAAQLSEGLRSDETAPESSTPAPPTSPSTPSSPGAPGEPGATPPADDEADDGHGDGEDGGPQGNQDRPPGHGNKWDKKPGKKHKPAKPHDKHEVD